ncbi:MAG: hypothetical protein KDB53_10185, partial [Planctomycetes bacterium]|nr:hypothetical protein [Planctomycetota bacterium]
LDSAAAQGRVLRSPGTRPCNRSAAWREPECFPKRAQDTAFDGGSEDRDGCTEKCARDKAIA